jgi:hypothetical protein
MVSQLLWEEADGNIGSLGEVVQMMVAEVLVIREELAGQLQVDASDAAAGSLAR